MLAKLKAAPNGARIVGTRRLTKAIEKDLVAVAYVALDADLFITRKIGELCQARRVQLVEVPTMKALGEACGIDVPTASAGLLR